MSDVFISYSRVDRARVEALAAALEASGFSIWWDKNIEGGSEFSKETEAQLNDARAVLVCWSKASVESLWVADEATVGRDKGRLVPVSLDATPPRIGFRQIQTIDFSGWTGDAAAPAFAQLQNALRAKLGGRSTGADVSAAPALPHANVHRGEAPKRAAFDWRWVAALGVAAFLVAAALWATRERTATSERSIAVLPFESGSPVAGDAEYGDWLAELVTSLLGKSDDLKVISQTSASTFKGEAAAASEIARRLGVALIVDGSIRSVGDDIVITAQLIDAASDRQIWAEIYERKTGNALAVQSEVAAEVASAVAGALDVTLNAGERAALTRSASSEALESYREALKLYRTTTEGNIRTAQRMLNDVVDADPGFTLAWALLSRVHSYFYFNQSDATEGRRAAAAEALAQAKRLDPELAEVLLADAYFEYWVKRDFDGARARFEELSAKWPNNADVLTALASIARRQNRWDDSKIYFERAVAIDPLRPGRRAKAAEANFATRDFAGALSQLDASLANWPDPPDSYPFIASKALVYQAEGRLDEADTLLKRIDPQPDSDLLFPIVNQAKLKRDYAETIAVLENLVRQDKAAGSPGRTSIDLNIGLADLLRLSGEGQRAEAHYREALDELRLELDKQPANADIHSYLAFAYSGLGERAKAKEHAAFAVTAVPVEKDALSGAYYLDTQARALARLGEADAAIPAIEALMRMPAHMPLTPALLRLDPDFDAIRADPRFVALSNGAS